MLSARALRLVALCLATALLFACAPPPTAPTPAPFVDDAGRSVTVKPTVNRIVSLAPSNTELLFALGLGDKVVGVTEYDDYPPEAKTKAQVGGFSTVDTERVVSLSPDVVFAANLHVGKVVTELEKLGLTVVVVDAKSVDDVLARLTTIGRLTGKEKEGQELRGKLSDQIKAVSDKARASGSSPRVFWMLGDGLFTAGPGSFVDDLIQKAGGTNIAASAKTQWPELSFEAVVAADPEVIVIPGSDGHAIAAKLKADPKWQQIAAVKTNHFVFIDDGNLVSRPGPRVVQGLDLLARGLHPEQFR